MVKGMVKKTFLYPLYEGGIGTIIIPAFIFTFSVFLSRIGGILFGSVGIIPGLILEIAVIGYSMGFLPQIVFFSSEGKNHPPYWKINRIDIEEWAKGLLPVVISAIESFFTMFIIIFLLSVIKSTSVLCLFRVLWKTISFILFSLFYPVNLLSWSVLEGFNIFHFLLLLSHKGIMYLLTVFPICLLSFVLLMFFLKWNNIFLIFMEYAIIFYLLQIYSYGLGRLYYIYSIYNFE